MFKSPFSFEGRIRRTEFGLSYLLCIIIIGLMGSMLADLGSAYSIVFLGFIPLTWFQWAQGAKRCHDLGNSGFFQLIPFYFLWMMFEDGEPKRNEYGLNPKGIGDQEIDEQENKNLF